MDFDEKMQKALLKSRTRAMYHTFIYKKPYEKGNLRIEFRDNTFYFYFRSDRPFLSYNIDTRKWEKIHAGIYENTASLSQQRKEAYKAIEEFNVKVLDQLQQ